MQRYRRLETGGVNQRRRQESMAIVSMKELLDRAGLFEKKLERYYASLRDESTDNGVRLLTYYLSRHRRHLEQALKEFSPEKIDKINNIKLKYDVEFHPERDFQLMTIPPQQVKGRDLLEAAVEYDGKLVGLYKSIVQQPLYEEAQELVQALIRLEERDIVMLKKMIAMDYF
jgi:hypothetical protein